MSEWRPSWWRLHLAALVASSPSWAAVIGTAAGWNAYIVLSLTLGGYVLVLTMAASLAR